MDIFNDHKLYPEEDDSIQNHYSEYFDSVFISFLPFCQFENSQNSSHSASSQISVEQFKNDVESFRDIALPSVRIYKQNDHYPEPDEIYKEGQAIRWESIISNSSLDENWQVNRALCTSIGAYKKALVRNDLQEILEAYTNTENIWHPREGTYDVLSKKAMFQLFKQLDINDVIVEDEFYENKKEIDLSSISEKGFIDFVEHKDYYIYSSDKDILISMDWDSFFFLVASSNENINLIEKAELFEGFRADDNTTHMWDWKEGEIDAFLKRNKPWWKKLI